METVYTITHSEIKLSSQTEIINVWMFGDIHRDAPSCDVDRWKWFLKKAKDSMNENTLFFGLGDYNDFASASEQKAIHSGKLHRETILKLDEVARKDNRALAMEMSFMRGKIAGLVEGNHTWKFYEGDTATEDLASRLDTQCVGWLNHHTLTVKFKNSARAQNIHFVLCHGKAGGKTAGITITQVDQLRSIFPIADVYCMGHDHQRTAHPMSVLIPSYGTKGVTMKQKRQFLCRSGSFKRAYLKGVSGYEVGRLLKPADLGALNLQIGFHRDLSDGDRLITDIEARI